MIEFRTIVRILFASYAMAVGGTIIFFVVLLALFGFDFADKIWRWFFFVPIFAISFIICAKNLKK